MLEAHSLYRFFHAGDDETLALQGVSLGSRARASSSPSPARPGRASRRCWPAWLAWTSPTAGSVIVDGARLSRRPEEERARIRGARIGMLFQQANLVGHLSVADNLALAQRIGDGSAPVASGASQVLERCGIDHRASRAAVAAVGGRAGARRPRGGARQRPAGDPRRRADRRARLADSRIGSSSCCATGPTPARRC